MQDIHLAKNDPKHYSTLPLIFASSNSSLPSDWASLLAKGGTTVLIILAMTLFVRVFLEGLGDLFQTTSGFNSYLVCYTVRSKIKKNEVRSKCPMVEIQWRFEKIS